MAKVTFPQGWRGHRKGAVVDFTLDQVKILQGASDCVCDVEYLPSELTAADAIKRADVAKEAAAKAEADAKALKAKVEAEKAEPPKPETKPEPVAAEKPDPPKPKKSKAKKQTTFAEGGS